LEITNKLLFGDPHLVFRSPIKKTPKTLYFWDPKTPILEVQKPYFGGPFLEIPINSYLEDPILEDPQKPCDTLLPLLGWTTLLPLFDLQV
jgi:hypothetical protein